MDEVNQKIKFDKARIAMRKYINHRYQNDEVYRDRKKTYLRDRYNPKTAPCIECGRRISKKEIEELGFKINEYKCLYCEDKMKHLRRDSPNRHKKNLG